MLHSRVHIEVGDLVILYMTRTEMSAITITPGQAFHNKFGRYRHEDMIGQKFGSKMHSPPPHSGYIYLLRPTPELWTLSLPHRTQILYMPDIAYIIMRLGVRVGGKVIEAGTGSGSMTHSLARAVGPKGYVGSFEYHATRWEKAREEFESHGLHNVHTQHRNVCKDGFGEVVGVEAVFLDLPAPWEAIPHAVKTLRPDTITKICCFSPCLEQVLKTVAALREHGFSDVSTQEVLVRTYELLPPPLPDSSHLRSVDDIVTDLRAHEKKKEERRATQMRTARLKARRIREEKAVQADPDGLQISMELDEMLRQELMQDVAAAGDGDGKAAGLDTGGQGPSGQTGRKRKAEDGVAKETDTVAAAADISRSPKKARTGLPSEDDAGADRSIAVQIQDPQTATGGEAPGAGPPDAESTSAPAVSGQAGIDAITQPADAKRAPSELTKRHPTPPPTTAAGAAAPTAKNASSSSRPRVTIDSQLLLRIQPEMRGHTSYLTFATFHPAAIRQQVAERSAAVSRPASGLAIASKAPATTDNADGTTAIPPPQVSAPKAQTVVSADADAADAEAGTERTETEYGDQALEEAIGTLTEEEMVAMMR